MAPAGAGIVLKFDKATYLAKITELEGLYKQLEQHLGTMEKLKQEMFNFWNDDEGREAGKVLTEQIRILRNSMDKINQTLTFYRSAVDELSSAKTAAGTAIGTALELLKLLG